MKYWTCNLDSGAGIVQDAVGDPVRFACDGFKSVTFSFEVVTGTWSSASVSIKRSNSISGPWFALPTPVAITSTAATQCTVPIDLDTKYLAAFVDPVNGAALVVNVDTYMRRETLGV